MLISESYRKLNEELHVSPRGFGASGRKHSNEVLLTVRRFECESVLDYGCGQGTLREALLHANPTLDVREYDPAIPGKSEPPQLLADLVVCTDVLEHVEPECLEEVLLHIHSLSRKATFFVIALTPGSKELADGTNTHKIVQPHIWWRDMLKKKWKLVFEEIRFDEQENPVDSTFWCMPL